MKEPASRKIVLPCGIVMPVIRTPLQGEKLVFVSFSGMPSARLSCA